MITEEEMLDLRAYTLLKPEIIWTLAGEFAKNREIDKKVLFSASYPLFLQERKKYAKDIKKLREDCKKLCRLILEEIKYNGERRKTSSRRIRR
jgi:hypothetical protein